LPALWLEQPLLSTSHRTVCHALSRPMTILTHAVFAIMLLLALLAGFWGHQRLPE